LHSQSEKYYGLENTGNENPAHDGRLESLLESDSDAPPQSTTGESEQSGDEGIDLEDWDDIDAILNAETKPIDQDVELKEFLADWLTKEDVSGADADRLIKGLNAIRHQGPIFTCLPNCSRTLLKTPRKVSVIPMAGGGVYYHFGLEKGIQHQLWRRLLKKIPSVVRGRVNTDGLPLSKISLSRKETSSISKKNY
jgi:hypothetical protein